MSIKKVLIVDDAEIVLRLEMAFLSRACFEVHTARRGEEALRKARELHPHIVLLDRHLPDMDGDEVCRLLKGDPATKGIHVVMVTADGSAECRASCKSSGCDGMLTKPFTRELLAGVVEETLGIIMRASPRVQVGTPCIVSWDGIRLEGVLGNLSEGGAFVCTKGVLPAAHPLELSFRLPGNRGPYRASITVRWAGRMGPGGPEGFGVCFNHMEKISRIELNSYLRRVLREAERSQVEDPSEEPHTTAAQ